MKQLLANTFLFCFVMLHLSLGHWAALKAFSLGKSLSTGNSKSKI